MHRPALFSTAALLLAVPLAAQQPAPPPAPPAAVPLAAGVEAPDFSLPAATIEGVSATPLDLKDLRGKVVVLAFFYQARTKG